jgi:hypothetical protein
MYLQTAPILIWLKRKNGSWLTSYVSTRTNTQIPWFTSKQDEIRNQQKCKIFALTVDLTKHGNVMGAKISNFLIWQLVTLQLYMFC